MSDEQLAKIREMADKGFSDGYLVNSDYGIATSTTLETLRKLLDHIDSLKNIIEMAATQTAELLIENSRLENTIHANDEENWEIGHEFGICPAEEELQLARKVVEVCQLYRGAMFTEIAACRNLYEALDAYDNYRKDEK